MGEGGDWGGQRRPLDRAFRGGPDCLRDQLSWGECGRQVKEFTEGQNVDRSKDLGFVLLK